MLAIMNHDGTGAKLVTADGTLDWVFFGKRQVMSEYTISNAELLLIEALRCRKKK